jgi:hypothetical protein
VEFLPCQRQGRRLPRSHERSLLMDVHRMRTTRSFNVIGMSQSDRCCRRRPECFALRYSSCELSVTAPKKSENADIQFSALGEKIMKVTTLILALLALALGTGTAMVVSVQTQPVVTCGSPNC